MTNFSDIKSTVVSRARILFSLMTTTIGKQYAVAEEAVVAFVEETTEEEFEVITSRLDEAGQHLVKAYQALLEVFFISRGIAVRAAENESLKMKVEDWVQSADHAEEQIQDMASTLVSSSLLSGHFDRTKKAVEGLTTGSGEKGADEDETEEDEPFSSFSEEELAEEEVEPEW